MVVSFIFHQQGTFLYRFPVPSTHIKIQRLFTPSRPRQFPLHPIANSGASNSIANDRFHPSELPVLSPATNSSPHLELGSLLFTPSRTRELQTLSPTTDSIPASFVSCLRPPALHPTSSSGASSSAHHELGSFKTLHRQAFGKLCVSTNSLSSSSDFSQLNSLLVYSSL
ncbi:hypothetical protein LXL04_024735 [Taraxacum kok-saghyz]